MELLTLTVTLSFLSTGDKQPFYNANDMRQY